MLLLLPRISPTMPPTLQVLVVETGPELEDLLTVPLDMRPTIPPRPPQVEPDVLMEPELVEESILHSAVAELQVMLPTIPPTRSPVAEPVNDELETLQ